MKLISLIQLLFVVVAKGRVLKNLRCWHCENARSVQECLHKGHSEKCGRNTQSCLIAVRSTNTEMTITRGCEQPEACRNVTYPHGRGSGSPTYCVSVTGGNSVCRCCCYTNDCAKTRLDCTAACEIPKPPKSEEVSMECGKSLENGRYALGHNCSFKCNYGDVSWKTTICTEDFNKDSKNVAVWLPQPCREPTCEAPKREGNVSMECEQSLENGRFALGSKCDFKCNYGPQISTCKLVDNVYRFEPRFSCCEPNCSTESADIVFVINTDFDSKEWKILQTFLKNFANKFEISPHYVQIGVVGCAYGEIDYIQLDEASTTKDFSNQIDFLEWDETCLEKDETLIFTVENAFVHDDPWFGNRKNATKMQVIYIANKDRAPKNSNYIKALESLGARMFGIGIDIDASERNHFKSFAGSDVIFLEHVDNLNTYYVMKKLISFACPKVC